jgi:hypothetical protein
MIHRWTRVPGVKLCGRSFGECACTAALQNGAVLKHARTLKMGYIDKGNRQDFVSISQCKLNLVGLVPRPDA